MVVYFFGMSYLQANSAIIDPTLDPTPKPNQVPAPGDKTVPKLAPTIP